MWSNKMPKRAGWYWVTDNKDNTYPVYLDNGCISINGKRHKAKSEKFVEWYSEPIAMPAKQYIPDDVRPLRMTQDMLADWSGLG